MLSKWVCRVASLVHECGQVRGERQSAMVARDGLKRWSDLQVQSHGVAVPNLVAIESGDRS